MTTPLNPDADTLARTLSVIHRIKNKTNQPNRDILSSAIDILWEAWDGEKARIQVTPADITSEDVQEAYEFLFENAPTINTATKYWERTGDKHPREPLRFTAEEFIDTEAKYTNGCLPSFRTWNAVYQHDGEVIAERTYNHYDDIEEEPVIDGIRYESTREETHDTGGVTVHLEENRLRTDIDVFIAAATGDRVKIEGHNGPNVTDETHPVTVLTKEFEWGLNNSTEAILKIDLETLLSFITEQDWEYDTAHQINQPTTHS